MLVLAVAYVAAVVFFVVAAPQGIIGYRTAFDSLRQLAYAGGAATLLCLVVLASSRRTGVSRAQASVATLLFAVPVAVMFANAATPPPGEPINDISTDLEDPPVFRAVIPLRPPGSNPIEYGGPAVAARQREAHPEVVPIVTALDKETAFQRAFETAEALGWEIVSGDMQSGIIEAVDTTRFFRFRDDVVVRIRENENGTRIDLRSRSRLGRSDLGKNARRILSFIEEFSK